MLGTKTFFFLAYEIIFNFDKQKPETSLLELNVYAAFSPL